MSRKEITEKRAKSRRRYNHDVWDFSLTFSYSFLSLSLSLSIYLSIYLYLSLSQYLSPSLSLVLIKKRKGSQSLLQIVGDGGPIETVDLAVGEDVT